MKYSTYHAVSVPVGPGFLNFDDSSTQNDEPETISEPEDTTVGESLFENFVDEIDTWARRALAANGFGDYL